MLSVVDKNDFESLQIYESGREAWRTRMRVEKEEGVTTTSV